MNHIWIIIRANQLNYTVYYTDKEDAEDKAEIIRVMTGDEVEVVRLWDAKS